MSFKLVLLGDVFFDGEHWVLAFMWMSLWSPVSSSWWKRGEQHMGGVRGDFHSSFFFSLLENNVSRGEGGPWWVSQLFFPQVAESACRLRCSCRTKTWCSLSRYFQCPLQKMAAQKCIIRRIPVVLFFRLSLNRGVGRSGCFAHFLPYFRRSD